MALAVIASGTETAVGKWTDGASATSTAFASAGASDFTNCAVNDTLVILTGTDVGEHNIATITDADNIVLSSALTATESSLEFYVRHKLTTSATGKTYVLVVNTTNLANDDEVELYITTKVLTGSTAELAYTASYKHIQANPNKYSVPVPADFSFMAELAQTGVADGTARAYEWSVLSLD